MSSTITALVLAAGFSNRFGSVKLCAELDNGQTVFSQTLANIQAAVADTVVITRPELAEQLIQHCDSLQIFDHAERGMGATLAYGISLLGECTACMICLADMPFIKADSYRQIADNLHKDRIVVPVYKGQAANPVGFGSDFFPELMDLTGDSGGRPVVQTHQSAVQRISIDDPGLLADIDTPDELSRLQKSVA